LQHFTTQPFKKNNQDLLYSNHHDGFPNLNASLHGASFVTPPITITPLKHTSTMDIYHDRKIISFLCSRRRGDIEIQAIEFIEYVF
jgi:hypothetical protein